MFKTHILTRVTPRRRANSERQASGSRLLALGYAFPFPAPRRLRGLKGPAGAALGLLVLAMLLPAPLCASKKKDDTPPPVNPGDKRVTGYFDVAKIVWPNPPAIPRIAFQDLFTGEKINPDHFTKKGHKQTWMDRLAGTQSADEIKMDSLPFQLIRTYGVGIDSKGLIYAADQGVAGVFIFDSEKKDHVELIGNGKQANFGLIAGLALDDDDSLFVADAQMHHILKFNAQHVHEATFGAEVLVRPRVWQSIGRTASSMWRTAETTS